MSFAYLGTLLIALAGMIVLDRRFRLFFWRDARRATIVLVVGLVFFLAWDLAGVGQGIFFRGETDFMTGLQVAPEVPLEEVFFLTLLCYLTMNAVCAGELVAKAVSGRRRDPSSDGRRSDSRDV
ncbi:MAG: lycopene cyclase domain-containing protein [Rhodoglobus sp.]